jgi:hypothetical protein
MTEWTFHIVRLCEATPFFYSGVTLAFVIVTLILIGRH